KSPKDFDLLIFICRANPPHNGHFSLFGQALKSASNVAILLGSSNVARSMRNPFYTEEREAMIRAAGFTANGGYLIDYLDDYPYNNTAWLEQVQQVVGKMCLTYLNKLPEQLKIGLIGFGKDNTSFYLNLFPQWTGVGAQPY